jgi:hypothetical protein
MTSRFAIGPLAGALLSSCSPPTALERPIAPQAALVRREPSRPPVETSSVVFVARWGNPAQTLARLTESTGQDLTRAALSTFPGSETALALETPVDLVVALDADSAKGSVRIRFALGLQARSLDSARKAAGSLGMRVQPDADGSIRFVADHFQCLTSAPASDPRPRLVCASDETDLRSLARYVLRELPNEPLATADIHAEFRLDALRSRFSGHTQDLSGPLMAALLDIQSRNQAFDRARGGLLGAMSLEFSSLIDDIERVNVDADVSPQTSDVSAQVSLELRMHTSRLVQTLLAQAASSRAPPDSFFRLPADSTASFFVQGLDLRRLEPEKQLLGALFGEVLGYQGAPPKLRDEAAELISAIPLPTGDLVMSSGSTPLMASPLSKLALAERDLTLERARFGWRVLCVDGPPDRYASYFVKLLSAFGDPVLGPQLRRFIGARRAEVPLQVSARSPGPGAGLPPRTRVIETTWPARELDPRTGSLIPTHKPGLRLLLVLLPDADGNRTLIGMGSDEKLVASKLRIVRDNRPAHARLSDRSGLSELASARTPAGGFWSPAALLEPIERGLPNQGRTPITYTLEVDAKAARASVRVRAPKAALVDLSSLWAESLGGFENPVHK